MLAKLIEDKSRILENLRGRKTGLENYDHLQRSLQCTDVTTDERYQSKFRKFYRVRRGQDWRRVFFSILEREKKSRAVSFDEVLEELYHLARHNGKQQIETSYASKLVATIRPELPVFDKYVKENLELQTPPYSMKAQERMDEFIDMYCHLHKKMLEMTQHKAFAKLRTCFDTAFPEYKHFTDVKKLDLFLWQYR